MSDYYKIVNYTKKEVIDLSSICSIKYRCIHSWSMQIAILTVFLGATYHRGAIDLGDDWIGRWRRDCIGFQCDANPTAEDEYMESEDWRDVGLDFLAFLRDNRMLSMWLAEVGMDTPSYVSKEFLLARLQEKRGVIS